MFSSKMYWRAHSLNVVLFAAMLDLGRSKPLYGLLWFTLLVAKAGVILYVNFMLKTKEKLLGLWTYLAAL